MKATLKKCDAVLEPELRELCDGAVSPRSGAPPRAVLEPELRELCDGLDAIQRCQTAEKFMRWANQLSESAMVMKPGIIPLVPPPKVSRGFFLVNLAQWQKDELKVLARDCGVDVRCVIGWAISKTKMQLEEKTRIALLAGIHRSDCWRFIAGNPKN